MGFIEEQNSLEDLVSLDKGLGIFGVRTPIKREKMDKRNTKMSFKFQRCFHKQIQFVSCWSIRSIESKHELVFGTKSRFIVQQRRLFYESRWQKCDKCLITWISL